MLVSVIFSFIPEPPPREEPVIYHSLSVAGNSMSPVFPDGTKIFYVETKDIAVGDYIIFDCKIQKCIGTGKASEIYHTTLIIKRLEKISNGQYWFVSENTGEHPCVWDNNVICSSLDSNSYGWIGEPDITIIGKVVYSE